MKKVLELAVKDAVESVERIASVKCFPEEYIDALLEVQEFVEVRIEAAREDMKRKQTEE